MLLCSMLVLLTNCIKKDSEQMWKLFSLHNRFYNTLSINDSLLGIGQVGQSKKRSCVTHGEKRKFMVSVFDWKKRCEGIF